MTAPRPQRSIRRRLALALAAYAASCVGLSLLAVYLGVVVPDRYRVDESLLEELGDLQALDDTTDHARVEEAITERSAYDAEPGWTYVYWEDETRLTLAGDKGPFSDDQLGLLPSPAGGEDALLVNVLVKERHFRAVRQSMPAGRSMVIARDITPQRTFESRLIETSIIVGLMALAVAVGTGLGLSRGLLGRVERMNGIILSILGGSREARVPVSPRHDEFDALARHFNELLDENTRLMAQVSDVTENIAHDLRTPLTRIRSSIESALVAARDPEADAEVMHRVLADTTGLLETFGALLGIARVESGAERSAMTSVELAPLARDVVELYEPAAEEAGGRIEFQAEEGVHVRGHRHLLSQALSNLVDNALKFAARSGPLEILVRRGPDGPQLIVADRGPGIPEQERARVLQRFVRLEQSRHEPGTGLGLSLVSAVAAMHGAELTLEDNAPGLRVTLTFQPASRDSRRLSARVASP